EPIIIVSSCQSNAWLLRAECLDKHLAASRSPPGPAGHLGQQLKRSLGRSKIGHVQSHVRLHHAHEGHIGKIESLGDHLRAKQYVDQSFSESGEHLFVTAALAHAVAIYPAYAVFGEFLFDFRLQLLRALALVSNSFFAARTAARWRILLVPAVMAKHDVAG